MRQSRCLAQVFGLSVFILLLAGMVASLGISPASKTLHYEAGTEDSFTIDILNSENANFRFGLSVTGELKDHISLDKTSIVFEPGVPSESVTFKITYPEGLEPGTHKVGVRLTPIFEESGSMVQALVAPELPVFVRVPYPAKYAKVGLLVFDAQEGNPVQMFLHFDNLGSETISAARGNITIFDSRGKVAGSRASGQISIVPTSAGKTELVPSSPLRKGRYDILVDYSYDEMKEQLRQELVIGTPKLSVLSIRPHRLSAGAINKLEVEVSSDWEEEIQVKGTVDVGGQKTEMSDFTVSRLGLKTVDAFADTRGLAEGNHSIQITLSYLGQETVETQTVEVVAERTFSSQAAGLPDWVFITIVVLVLMAVVVVLSIYLWYRKKNA